MSSQSIKSYKAIVEKKFSLSYKKIFQYNDTHILCLNDTGKLELLDIDLEFISSDDLQIFLFSNLLINKYKWLKFVCDDNGYFGLIMSNGTEKKLITGNMSNLEEQQSQDSSQKIKEYSLLVGKYKLEELPSTVIDFTISSKGDYYYLYNDKTVKIKNQTVVKTENLMLHIIPSHHHTFLLHNASTKIEVFTGTEIKQYTIEKFYHIISLFDYGYATYSNNNSINIYSPDFVHIMTLQMSSSISQLIHLSHRKYVYLDKDKNIIFENIPNIPSKLPLNESIPETPLYIKNVLIGTVIIAYTDRIELYFGNKKLITSKSFTDILKVYLYKPNKDEYGYIHVVTKQSFYNLSLSLVVIDSIDLNIFKPFEQLIRIEKQDDVYTYIIVNGNIKMYKNNNVYKTVSNNIYDIMLINNGSQILAFGNVSYIYDFELNVISTIYSHIVSATQVTNNTIVTTIQKGGELIFYSNKGSEIYTIKNSYIVPSTKIFNIGVTSIISITNGHIKMIKIQFEKIKYEIKDFIENNNKETKEMRPKIYINYNFVNDKLNFTVNGRDLFEQIKFYKDKITKANKLSFEIIKEDSEDTNSSIEQRQSLKIIFTELGKYIKETSRFFSSQNTISGEIYSFKTDLQLSKSMKIDLQLLGRLIGKAIIHEIPIGIKLHPLILYTMIKGKIPTITEDLIREVLEDYDRAFLSTDPFKCFNSIHALHDSNCRFDEDKNTTINIVDNQSIMLLRNLTTRRITKLIKSQEPFLNYFVKGFQSIIPYRKNISLKNLDRLINGITDLTIDMIKLITIFKQNDVCNKAFEENNIPFSSSPQKEMENIFWSILQSNQEKDPKYLNIFLQTLTGSPYIFLGINSTTESFIIEITTRRTFEILPNDRILHIPCSQIIDYIKSSNKEDTEIYKSMSIESLQEFINKV